MADLLFFLAGVVLLFRKEVHISRTRKLTGRPVMILALLYLLPFLVSFIGGLLVAQIGAPMQWAIIPSTGLSVIAILSTVFVILFYKK
jgi:uncharacterized membrane protein YfcA